MKQNLKRNIKKGFSMIELIIVIAVLGVLTAVVLNQAQGMRESSNLNRESSNLGMLTTAIQSTFNSQGSYSGLNDDIITSSTSFPNAMVNSADTIKTVWDDDGVDVFSAKYNGQEDAGFVVMYKNVPTSACMDFVSQNYSSFFAVNVGDTGLSPDEDGTEAATDTGTRIYSSDPVGTKPYSVGDAQTACGTAANSKDILFFSR